MKTVFMTRKQFDFMCGKWSINGPEQNAYIDAKRRWTMAGVFITTANARLINLIAAVKRDCK